MTELKTGRIPEELYREILQVMARPCVDIVAKCSGEVLLLLRRIEPLKNFWALPGGMVNKGETRRETAIRKVYEELGVKAHASDLRLVGIADHFHPMRQDIAITYVLTLESKPEITLDYQHRESKWFTFEGVIELGELIDMQVLRQIEFAYGMGDRLGDV